MRIAYLLVPSRRLILRFVQMYILRKKIKIQAQNREGIANHGVTATIITITVIEISPITITSNMHIDNIKSTTLISLANLKTKIFYKLN